MALLYELKRRAPHVVGPLVGSLLVAYFAFHAVEGDRGIRAWQRLDGEVADARYVRDRLVAEQTAFERRVAMLRPESLDSDLLEERARVVLGFIPNSAIVIGNGVAPSPRLTDLAVVR